MPCVRAEFISRHRNARIIEPTVEAGSLSERQDNSAQVNGKPTERDMTVDGDEFEKQNMLSKALFLYEPSSTDKTKMTPHDCYFDLTSRLGESSLERNDDVPIDHIFSRGHCCRRRISRYGLILLVSRHHQEITLGKKLPESITSVIVETSLGRFTYYTHRDRDFVDFDASIWSSSVPLIPNQNMDEILLGARGYYLINDRPQSKNFVWRRCSNDSSDSLERLASGNFFGVPDAVIYMPEVILKKWKRLERFSLALLDAMNCVLDGLHEPASFTAALQNLPQDYGSSLENGISMSTIEERLAACVCLCRALSKKNLIEMDFDNFHMFALMTMGDLIEAHQHFRSPAARFWELFKTSQDRFMRLLRRYMEAEHASESLANSSVRDGLLGLLHANRNNVSLVVFQGFLATVVRWNCCRVLSRARQAPEEWIKFVVADDDDIYMT